MNGDTISIIMKGGVETIIDKCDYIVVSNFRWFTSRNHVCAIKNNSVVWLHRLINKTPVGMETDHINRNGLDNRRSNLRSATRSQNATNYKRNPKSGYRGVYFSVAKLKYKRYLCVIQVKGKSKFIGNFKDKLGAATAYDKAAIKYHGEFAVLNFPRSNYEKENL